MLSFEDLTKKDILEIIEDSNHNSSKDIKEFMEDGLLYVYGYGTKPEVYTNYISKLSSGKTVVYID